MDRSAFPRPCGRISEPPRLNDFPASLRPALAALSPRKKYLIGVSGGCDSMVLLHVLHQQGYQNLIVCHLHHGLRGKAATRDATLVRTTAKRLGYACEVERVQTATAARRDKKSLELAARDLRLNFFATCARKHRCPRLLLAHHADDQVETCLFHFLRGSGASGLAGIRPVSRIGRLEVFRPLLTVPRSTLAAWADENKIPHHEDATNTSPVHTRNRLRHEVLPAVLRVMPSCQAAILRTADILREEDAWMESLVPSPPTRLKTRELRTFPLALQRRLVLRWLTQQGVPEAGFQETTRVLSLLNSDDGPAKINLPGNHHARRRNGEIFLEKF